MELDLENIEQSADFLDKLVYQNKQKYLTDTQKLVLEESLRGKTYEEMAMKNGYSINFICRDIGKRLFEYIAVAIFIRT